MANLDLPIQEREQPPQGASETSFFSLKERFGFGVHGVMAVADFGLELTFGIEQS